MPQDRLRTAQWLALLLPLALLAGAWGSQLIGGLVPCEMCHWQRWPHYAALVIAAAGLLFADARTRRAFTILAALAIAVSGVIGVLHAGVEYHWWPGFTACTTTVKELDPMELLRKTSLQPFVRCDAAQWSLFGISLAGFNAILSLGGAITILFLALAPARRR